MKKLNEKERLTKLREEFNYFRENFAPKIDDLVNSLEHKDASRVSIIQDRLDQLAMDMNDADLIQDEEPEQEKLFRFTFRSEIFIKAVDEEDALDKFEALDSEEIQVKAEFVEVVSTEESEGR